MRSLVEGGLTEPDGEQPQATTDLVVNFLRRARKTVPAFDADAR